jgi:hypothetical protein
MQPAVPAPPSPADAATVAAGWRSRVEDATDRAAVAMAGGDLRGLAWAYQLSRERPPTAVA